jgi:hypothetical protein
VRRREINAEHTPPHDAMELTFLASPFSIAWATASANLRTSTSSPDRGLRLTVPNPLLGSPAPRVATRPVSLTVMAILPTVTELKSTSCCHAISTPLSPTRDAYTGRAPTRMAAMSYVRRIAGAHFVASLVARENNLVSYERHEM